MWKRQDNGNTGGELRVLRQKLSLKMREAVLSVAPVTVIVLVLSMIYAPGKIGMSAGFLVGALLLVVGMGLFTQGADMAMMPMGQELGARLTSERRLILLILATFVLGLLITIAEPDLQVLAGQVPGVPDDVLVWSVAIGVGLFLVLALLRIVFQLRLSYVLIAAYALVFMVAVFAPADYIAVAFDSGGVTTGPVTVPFIMALGLGVAAVRPGRKAREDSFGLVALSSCGPVLAVLILAIFYRPNGGIESEVNSIDISSGSELIRLFGDAFPEYFRDVGVALIPIIAVFAVFQFSLLHLRRRRLIRIGIGLVYTYIGLVLFLTGVNVGFMPTGYTVGSLIGASSTPWLLIPIGALVGFFVVMAEPAVQVLNQQVEEITVGEISRNSMLMSMAAGVATALAIAMSRLVLGFSIWWVLVPGYALAIGLTFVTPPVFTAVAFDSGGVASGPMTAAFLLPFSLGACASLGGNVLLDAFGLVAMVALTPLITIQILGLSYKHRMAGMAKADSALAEGIRETVEDDLGDDDIISVGGEDDDD